MSPALLLPAATVSQIIAPHDLIGRATSLGMDRLDNLRTCIGHFVTTLFLLHRLSSFLPLAKLPHPGMGRIVGNGFPERPIRHRRPMKVERPYSAVAAATPIALPYSAVYSSSSGCAAIFCCYSSSSGCAAVFCCCSSSSDCAAVFCCCSSSSGCTAIFCCCSSCSCCAAMFCCCSRSSRC
jgi:hypothetical protein